MTTHHQDGQWAYHLTRLRFPFYPRPSFPLGPVSSPGLPPPQNTSDRPSSHTWPATPSWACWAHLLSNYLDWKMEALKGWLQLQGPGLLEVSGKARQFATNSQRFVQQHFSTLADQCQFSNLVKECQQFLVNLSQQVRKGHLPLEYLIVGGDVRDFSV